jgi:hypothetical protein
MIVVSFALLPSVVDIEANMFGRDVITRACALKVAEVCPDTRSISSSMPMSSVVQSVQRNEDQNMLTYATSPI